MAQKYAPPMPQETGTVDIPPAQPPPTAQGAALQQEGQYEGTGTVQTPQTQAEVPQPGQVQVPVTPPPAAAPTPAPPANQPQWAAKQQAGQYQGAVLARGPTTETQFNPTEPQTFDGSAAVTTAKAEGGDGGAAAGGGFDGSAALSTTTGAFDGTKTTATAEGVDPIKLANDAIQKYVTPSELESAQAHGQITKDVYMGAMTQLKKTFDESTPGEQEKLLQQDADSAEKLKPQPVKPQQQEQVITPDPATVAQLKAINDRIQTDIASGMPAGAANLKAQQARDGLLAQVQAISNVKSTLSGAVKSVVGAMIPGQTGQEQPASQTASSLMMAGHLTGYGGNVLDAKNQADKELANGKISQEEHDRQIAAFDKAQSVLSSPEMSPASMGPGASPKSIQDYQDAEARFKALMDEGNPDWGKYRPAKAAYEARLSYQNLEQSALDALQRAQTQRSGGQLPEQVAGTETHPFIREIPLYKRNMDQISASADLARTNAEAEIAKFTPTPQMQKEVGTPLAELQQHDMEPEKGASTGLQQLIQELGITASNVLPLPGEGAIVGAIERTLGETAGRVLGWTGEKTYQIGKASMKKGWQAGVGRGVTGALSAEMTRFIQDPPHYFERWYPSNLPHTALDLGWEAGLPTVVGGIVGGPTMLAGKLQTGAADVLKSLSPEFRQTVSSGERAVGTTMPYRAGQPLPIQVISRGLDAYLRGGYRALPWAAPDVMQGDVGRVAQDINQGGLTNFFLHLPQNSLDSFRGSFYDPWFVYRGQDPNTPGNKAILAKPSKPLPEHWNPAANNGAGAYVDLSGASSRAEAALDPSRRLDFRALQDTTSDFADTRILPDKVIDDIAAQNGATVGPHGLILPPNAKTLSGKYQIFIRQGSFDMAGWHELAGHLRFNTMTPAEQANFIQLVSQSRNVDDFANTYANKANPGVGKVDFSMLPTDAEFDPRNPSYNPTKAAFGRSIGNLTQEQAYREMAAETMGALYSGQSAQKWTQSPSLLRRFAYFVGSTAEAHGLPTTTPDVNGPLGVTKSMSAAKMADQYLRDFANHNIPVNIGRGTPPIWAPGVGGLGGLGGPGGGGGAGARGFTMAGATPMKQANVVGVRTVVPPQPQQQQQQLTSGTPTLPPPAPTIAEDQPGPPPQQINLPEVAETNRPKVEVPPIAETPVTETKPTVNETQQHTQLRQYLDTGQTPGEAQQSTELGTGVGNYKPAGNNVTATEFGYVDRAAVAKHPEQYPSGNKGFPDFGTVDLSPANQRGVSLPPEALNAHFGNVMTQDTKGVWHADPKFAAAVRNHEIQVEVTNPANGQKALAPIVDIGPGAQTGAGLDVLHGTAQDVGFTSGKAPLTYRIAGGGPPTQTIQAQSSVHPNSLVAAAVANVGHLNTTQDPGVQGGALACADAVTRIVHDQLGIDLPKTNSTAELYDNLRKGGWKEVDPNTPGAIIVSPTQGGRHGHTGIVGENGEIYSNSSANGLWGKNYTVDSWKRSFADLGVHAFVPGEGVGKVAQNARTSAAFMPGGGGELPSQAPATPATTGVPFTPTATTPAATTPPPSPDRFTEPETTTPARSYATSYGTEQYTAGYAPQTQQVAQPTAGRGGGAEYAAYMPGGGGAIGGTAAYMPGAGAAPGGIGPTRVGGIELEGGPPTTRGIPNPGGAQLEPLLSQNTPQSNAQAAVLHTNSLSPDDTRVRKQADNMVKGEHFQAGDPFHTHVLSNVPDNEKQVMSQAQNAIANRQAMHLSYASAPKVGLQPVPTTKSRQIEYDMSSPQARMLKTTQAQIAGHSMIPTAVGVGLAKKQGAPHEGYIQGISTNAAANNHHQINSELAAMGHQTPYPKLNNKFNNDLEGYVSNLNAGWKGTGESHAAGTDEYPNLPNPNHIPYRLKRHEADFLNAVINNQAARAKSATGIRELARKGGTLLSEEGETNPIRHAIDAHQAQVRAAELARHPDNPRLQEAAKGRWSDDTLERTIRTFKAGLVHEIHEHPEQMPEAIRPGDEFKELTKSLQRQSIHGRPDIPMAAAFMPGGGRKLTPTRGELTPNMEIARNKALNRIERDFAEGRKTEDESRERLESIGEDHTKYRFMKDRGMITPHEESPEALTPEEHSQLTNNIRQQWLSGKLKTDEYKQRMAEIPLPEKPSAPPPTREGGGVPEAESQSMRPLGYRAAIRLPNGQVFVGGTHEDAYANAGEPHYSSGAEYGFADKGRNFIGYDQADELLNKAYGEGKPPSRAAAFMPGAGKKLATKLEKPDWETADEPTRQKYLKTRVKQILANQSTDESAVPLKPLKNDDGSYKYDPAGNPTFEKPGYNLVNSPLLKKKGLDQLGLTPDAKEQEDTVDPDQHGHLNFVERRRLSALRKASAVETMADKILESYNSIKDIPEIAGGKGWYSRMRQKLKDALGPDNEIFAQLLGATSAKTPVRSNFIQALDAYEQWKRGDFDRHAQKYLEAHRKMEEGDGALTQHMRNLGILGENDPDHPTEADALAHWIRHHDILPMQQNGSKYNANSNAVLKVLAGTWLKEADAPKTPNFAGNLSGRTMEATIDVWAARHLKRLGYEGQTRGKPWRDQAKGENGVSGLDFAFSQDAMRSAADKIGINPDDLQAILWYAEKDHYEKQGWTRGEGAKKASFDDVFDKVFGRTGEPMNSAEVRAHYAEEAKTARKLADKVKTARKYQAAGSPKLEAYMQKHKLTPEHLAAPEEEEEEEAA